MKTSNTYTNVAECISILDFNMEKLFDEMESTLLVCLHPIAL